MLLLLLVLLLLRLLLPNRNIFVQLQVSLDQLGLRLLHRHVISNRFLQLGLLSQQLFLSFLFLHQLAHLLHLLGFLLLRSQFTRAHKRLGLAFDSLALLFFLLADELLLFLLNFS